MKPVISIDFDLDAAKVLFVSKDYKVETFEIPLGFRLRTRRDTRQLFSHVISEIESEIGEKVLGEIPILIEGENIRVLKSLKGVNVLTLFDVLRKFGSPVLDVEKNFLFFLDRLFFPVVEESKLLRWLTFEETLDNIRNHLENAKKYPQSIPQSSRDFQIELSHLREKIIAIQELYNWDIKDISEPLVVSGSLISKVEDFNTIFLAIIDSLNFVGNLELSFDRDHMLSNLAALKSFDEKIYLKIKDDPKVSLTRLGSVVCIPDNIKFNLNLGMNSESEVSLRKGSVYSIPIPSDVRAPLTIKSKKFGMLKYEVSGGEIGLAVDTREKPIVLDMSVNSRHKLLGNWQKALNVEHI